MNGKSLSITLLKASGTLLIAILLLIILISLTVEVKCEFKLSEGFQEVKDGTRTYFIGKQANLITPIVIKDSFFRPNAYTLYVYKGYTYVGEDDVSGSLELINTDYVNSDYTTNYPANYSPFELKFSWHEDNYGFQRIQWEHKVLYNIPEGEYIIRINSDHDPDFTVAMVNNHYFFNADRKSILSLENHQEKLYSTDSDVFIWQLLLAVAIVILILLSIGFIARIRHIMKYT